jgi:hypothetical protein
MMGSARPLLPAFLALLALLPAPVAWSANANCSPGGTPLSEIVTRFLEENDRKDPNPVKALARRGEQGLTRVAGEPKSLVPVSDKLEPLPRPDPILKDPRLPPSFKDLHGVEAVEVARRIQTALKATPAERRDAAQAFHNLGMRRSVSDQPPVPAFDSLEPYVQAALARLDPDPRNRNLFLVGAGSYALVTPPRLLGAPDHEWFPPVVEAVLLAEGEESLYGQQARDFAVRLLASSSRPATHPQVGELARHVRALLERSDPEERGRLLRTLRRSMESPGCVECRIRPGQVEALRIANELTRHPEASTRTGAYAVIARALEQLTLAPEELGTLVSRLVEAAKDPAFDSLTRANLWHELYLRGQRVYGQDLLALLRRLPESAPYQELVELEEALGHGKSSPADDTAHRRLLALAESPDAAIRIGAVYLIGQIPKTAAAHGAARRALIHALFDVDHHVRKSADDVTRANEKLAFFRGAEADAAFADLARRPIEHSREVARTIADAQFRGPYPGEPLRTRLEFFIDYVARTGELREDLERHLRRHFEFQRADDVQILVKKALDPRIPVELRESILRRLSDEAKSVVQVSGDPGLPDRVLDLYARLPPDSALAESAEAFLRPLMSEQQRAEAVRRATREPAGASAAREVRELAQARYPGKPDVVSQLIELFVEGDAPPTARLLESRRQVLDILRDPSKSGDGRRDWLAKGLEEGRCR